MLTDKAHPVFEVIRKYEERKGDTIDKLKRGEFDSEVKAVNSRNEKAAKSCFSLWVKAWNRNAGAVRFTGKREQTWRKAMGEGWKPSDFARGIVGMTFDPWSERDAHCDWHYVLRGMERWLELHSKHGDTPALRRASLDFPTKVIGGVVLPIDYRWEDGDTFCRNAGERFDPMSRKWHKPGSDIFSTLYAVNFSQDSSRKEGFR